MIFEFDEQWSSFFRRTAWTDFTVVKLVFEANHGTGVFHIEAGLLGFCFHVGITYHRTPEEG